MEGLTLIITLAGKVMLLLVRIGQFIFLIPGFKALKRTKTSVHNSKISNLRAPMIEFIYTKKEEKQQLEGIEASSKQISDVKLKILL